MERHFTIFGRYLDDRPYTIRAASFQPNERGHLTYAGTAILPYKDDGEGLPAAGELERIDKIEEQLESALAGHGALLAGRLTGSGRSRLVFYGPAECPSEVIVKTGFLKKDGVSVDWRHDPEWSLYDLELQPTPEETMMDRFRFLWSKLFELGDNPDLPRQVDFTFVFPDETARGNFLEQAAGSGYSHEGEVPPVENGRYWCELAYTTAISPEVLVPHCVELDAMAKRHGGEFDGWACPVTSG